MKAKSVYVFGPGLRKVFSRLIRASCRHALRDKKARSLQLHELFVIMDSLLHDNGTSWEDVLEVLEQDEVYCKMLSELETMEESASPNNARNDCKVCGSPALGFNYYGTVCCNACRAFFKRAIVSGESADCGKLCEEKCRKCRLRNCLQAGMRPELIKNTSRTRVVPTMTSIFTLEDEIWVKGLYAGAVAAVGKFVVHLDSTDTFKCFVEHLYDGKLVANTLYGKPGYEKESLKHIGLYYTGLPEFQRWPKTTALKMLQELIPLTSEISLAQNVKSSFIIVNFFHEMANWLAREGDKQDLLDLLNSKLRNGQPRTLRYEEAYPHVKQECQRKHRARVNKIAHLLDDTISTMLAYMVIINDDNKVGKNRYLKTLNLYWRSQDDASKRIKDVATLASTLKDMRTMRWCNYKCADESE